MRGDGETFPELMNSPFQVGELKGETSTAGELDSRNMYLIKDINVVSIKWEKSELFRYLLTYLIL